MTLYDKNLYLSWDPNTSMNWMFEEVFVPIIQHLKKDPRFRGQVEFYNQTFKDIRDRNQKSLISLLTRDNRKLNGDALLVYCKIFDGVFEEVFGRMHPNALNRIPDPASRKFVFERMYLSQFKRAFTDLRCLVFKRSGGTMCSFAKSLQYLGGGAFGAVFRVNDGRKQPWTVKVSEIQLKKEDAMIQQTSGIARGFNSATQKTITMRLREIECTNTMAKDLHEIEATLKSGKYEGAELAQLQAKTSMLLRTQIDSRNFGLQIFSDKLILVQELEFMNQSNLEIYKSNLLKNNRRPDVAQLAQITFDLLMGLAFLHNRNIIHRDISADNVLVHVNNMQLLEKVVIADFRSCRFFRPANEEVHHRDANEQFMSLEKAVTMGKYHYKPPEGVHRPSMYDQKWDVFQIGIVLWSLFCDEAHPYQISSETIRIIQSPSTSPTKLLAELLLMQIKNLGFPSAIEWEQLHNFTVPNVQGNQQEEMTRRHIMNQFREIITSNPDQRAIFEDVNYDTKAKRINLILERVHEKAKTTVDPASYENNTAFLKSKIACGDSTYSSYVSILADMLHFVPEPRLTAVEALGKFRHIFMNLFEAEGWTDENGRICSEWKVSSEQFSSNFPDLAFLESLNLTKFSRDVNFEDFEKTIRRFSGVSSTIEVMSAPDRIYVPEEFTKPPNSHVMHVGMKALKLFAEKELKNNPKFLEELLNNLDEENHEAAKIGLLEQLKMLLPITWSEQMIQNWFYSQAEAIQYPDMFKCKNCGKLLNFVGMGLTGSVVFSSKIQQLETEDAPERCGKECGSKKMTESQKKFVVAITKKRVQEFFHLHGFEMNLLDNWQNGEVFPIDQVGCVVTGLSDETAETEGSYQELLTHSLKIDEKVAFSFKMSVSTEADAEVIYFVFSYPKKDEQ